LRDKDVARSCRSRKHCRKNERQTDFEMYSLPHGNNNMLMDLLLTHKTFVNTTIKFIGMESYSPNRTVWNFTYIFIKISLCTHARKISLEWRSKRGRMKLTMQNTLVIRGGARKSSFLYLFIAWFLRDVL